MRNIQVIDGAINSVYDVFQATDKEFVLIFPEGEDIAFIDEVLEQNGSIGDTLAIIWTRRIPKRDVHGIHGLLFYQLEKKKVY